LKRKSPQINIAPAEELTMLHVSSELLRCLAYGDWRRREREKEGLSIV